MSRKQRPGFMVYFDQWEPISRLGDSDVAELVRSALKYCKYGEVPELSGISGIFWDMIRPMLDRDAEKYEESVTNSAYAGYSSSEKRAGRVPLTREEWNAQRMSTVVNGGQQALTGVDECQPIRTTTTDTATIGETNTTTERKKNTTSTTVEAIDTADYKEKYQLGIGEGESEGEMDFERKKRERMAMLDDIC